MTLKNGELRSDYGYIASHPPHGRVFRRALDEELRRPRVFLGLDPDGRFRAVVIDTSDILDVIVVGSVSRRAQR